MLAAIIAGMALTIITVGLHAVGTTGLVRSLVRRYADSRGLIRAGNRLAAVIRTALILLALHVVEIAVWALAYLMLFPADRLRSFEEAFYFSSVTFTALGYGDITLSAGHGRLLSGLEALDGMLLLGWSTALLFAVVHRMWEGYAPAEPGK
jgi:voltage-gated potassium channel